MSAPDATTPLPLAAPGLTLIAWAAAAPCPANDSTTLVLASGKVYRYQKIDQRITYDKAKGKCTALDSYPVVYNTWREQLAVESYFEHQQNLGDYWLGLRQVGNKGVW